jgi:hypothetical protein
MLQISARMCIFLAFLRQGIPLATINAKYIGTERSWRERKRIAWPSAQWLDVPVLKHSSSLSAIFSFVWWTQAC